MNDCPSFTRFFDVVAAVVVVIVVTAITLLTRHNSLEMSTGTGAQVPRSGVRPGFPLSPLSGCMAAFAVHREPTVTGTLGCVSQGCRRCAGGFGGESPGEVDLILGILLAA